MSMIPDAEIKGLLISLFTTCCELEDFAVNRIELNIEDYQSELSVLQDPDLHPECVFIEKPEAKGYEFWLDEGLVLRIYSVTHFIMSPKYKRIKSWFKSKNILRSEETNKFLKLYDDLQKIYNAELKEEEDRHSLYVYEYYIEFDQIKLPLDVTEYNMLENYYKESIPLALVKLANNYLDDFLELDEDDEEYEN